MSLKIKTWRDPYDVGFSTTRPKEIEIKEGLTVLVGCNGAGKSTLLRNIRDFAMDEGIPYFYHDNERDGDRGNYMQVALMSNNIAGLIDTFSASEGEAISIQIYNIARQLHQFLVNGDTDESKKKRRWVKIFDENFTYSNPSTNKRIILLDAIDSGYSIDNVIELKESLLKFVFEDAKSLNMELYVIISANEYEMACGEKCFDVNSGRYIELPTYDHYKNFIMMSRKKKDKRIERVNEKIRNRKEKNGQEQEELWCNIRAK
jgi:predicted ATPase